MPERVNSKAPIDDYIEVHTEWYVPPDLVARYANNAVIQNTEGNFIISFFETLPPILVGTPEEQREQAAGLGSIRSQCVARLIIPEARISSIISLLQNYVAHRAQTTEEE